MHPACLARAARPFWREIVRRLVIVLLIAFIFVLPAIAQQGDTAAATNTAFCTFQDQNELSVRYRPAEYKKGVEVPNGKVWSPDGAPIFLFTPTELKIGTASLPTGAYSVYILRNRGDWTLIVNKNVKEGSEYDPQQDLARVPMQTGKISNAAKTLSINLGHISPKVCSLQLNYGETGAWADFSEK